jgi:hypothetical protein
MTHLLYYYNVDLATHDNYFSDLNAKDNRIIDICVSGTTSNVRYTASWVTGVPGPSQWQERVGMNRTGYEQISSEFASHGLVPTCISVTGTPDDAVFAGIWESPPAPVTSSNAVYLDVPSPGMADSLKTIYNSGAPIAIKEYGTPTDRHYAILATIPESLLNTTYEYSETSPQY